MLSYLIPAKYSRTEHQVKRSLFICHIEHCPDRDAADQFIRHIAKQHKDANHNCWAMVAGSPADPTGYGMNDDGEPRGCAGKPMFNVLHHSGIGEICVVVSRYFGGIKLGTGGMARAYSSSVQCGLEILATTEKVHHTDVELVLPYELLKTVEHLSLSVGGQIVESEYGADIRLKLHIPSAAEEEFSTRIQEASQGRIIYSRH